MKKVLVVSFQCISSPLNEKGYGGSLYCMIKAQKDYSVDFLYFGQKDYESEQEMSKYYNNIYHHDLSNHNSKVNTLWNLLIGKPKLATGYKYSIIPELDNKVYDIAVYDTITSLEMCEFIKSKKHIAFMIDSTPLYYKRRSKTENIIHRMYSIIQSYQLLHYERRFMKKIDRFVYVSKVDCEYEKRINKCRSDFRYINNGVFLDDIDSSFPKNNLGMNIMFSGIMDYAPNRDAVEYIVNDIFPSLVRKFPNIKLYIVGKNAEEIKSLESDNVIVTGRVENIYSYIKAATVYISPLRFGTGMKNKILEAMACKKAIVASKTSIEGIDELQHEANILVASSTDQWIEYISKLLCDKQLCERYGEACYSIVKQNYSWSSAFDSLVN